MPSLLQQMGQRLCLTLGGEDPTLPFHVKSAKGQFDMKTTEYKSRHSFLFVTLPECLSERSGVNAAQKVEYTQLLLKLHATFG